MKKSKTRMIYVTLIVVSALLATGCADVTQIDKCAIDSPYGFWGGLWHGIVAPISFIGSLISDNIAFYALNNNGKWYDFGFVIGAGLLIGAGRNEKR